MTESRNSAGRIPFFVEDGKIVFGLLAENNRLIDKEFIREQCGDAAARLVPENFITYGLPRGRIKTEETATEGASRESAEEIHYNATKKPIPDEDGRPVPPHAGPIKTYMKEIIPVDGKRGKYDLIMFVDRIEPRSFKLKPIEPKVDDKVRPGHTFQQGGKWGTIADLEESVEVFRRLAKHRDIMTNEKVSARLDAHIGSMESQLTGMKEIEAELVRRLREEGIVVRPGGGRSVV